MADSGEIRTAGQVTGPGSLNVLHGRKADLLEMTVQTSIAAVVQWFEDGIPISGAWALVAGEKWSAPGKIVQGDLNLSVSTAATVTYELRWVLP